MAIKPGAPDQFTLPKDSAEWASNNIFFIDSLYGFIPSWSGRIFKTQDGGNSWITLNAGVNTTLLSAFFTSKLTGYCVGAEETILKTTNGGVSWKRLHYLAGGNSYFDTGSSEMLTKMVFPDSLNGWCIGSNGTILYLNEDKTIPKVMTVAPLDTFMCTTGTYGVRFAVNKRFNTDNIFTAQLSDGQGNWASLQALGTLASDTSGIVNFTLPSNQALNGNYRIRMVASSPAYTSVQTQSPLSIDKGTPATVTIASTTDIKCEGNPLALKGLYTNGGSDPMFQWLVNGVATNNSTDFSSSTLKNGDKVSFQLFSSADCPVPRRPITTIDAPVTPKPAKPSISTNGLTLTSSVDNGNQWAQNGTDIPAANLNQYEVTSSGTYTVKVTQGNCSSDYSDPIELLVTGIEENSLGYSGTSIFPIPCQGTLHFKADYLVQTATVKDMTGKIIVQEAMNQQTNGLIDLNQANIHSGIYYLELVDSEGKPHRNAFVKQ